jgi:hypothetical protein
VSKSSLAKRRARRAASRACAYGALPRSTNDPRSTYEHVGDPGIGMVRIVAPPAGDMPPRLFAKWLRRRTRGERRRSGASRSRRVLGPAKVEERALRSQEYQTRKAANDAEFARTT